MKKILALILLLVASVTTAQVVVPLREDTVVSVKVGPFIDRADMVSYEPGLISNLASNLKVSKNFGTFAARDSGTAITYDSLGYYYIPLSIIDTDTPGQVILAADDGTTYLPFKATFVVYPQTVFDALQVGAANTLSVAVGKIGTQVLSANVGSNYNTFFDNGGATSLLTIGNTATAASLSNVQTGVTAINTTLTGAPTLAAEMAAIGATPTRFGKLDAAILNVSTDAADNFDRSAKSICTGTVGTGSTNVLIKTETANGTLDPSAEVANQFVGRVLIFDENTATPALRGQATVVISNTIGGDLTVTALTTNPSTTGNETFTLN